LAFPLCGTPALAAAAQNYEPNANIGDVYHPWNPLADGYSHWDIIQLVVFYNVDFGIGVGDPIDVRRTKVRTWLIKE